MNASNANLRQPLLVTGAHRSGTTWVGTMLAASGRYAYVSEPLNVWHRQGVLHAPVAHWYTYICEDNQDQFLVAYQDTIQLRYRGWAEVSTLSSAKDIGRMLRDSGRFLQGRIGRRAALLKDPFAIFSADWFAQTLGCQVVITVRHPAAFISSLKRLNWTFNFSHLLEQSLLLRDWLAPFWDQMQAAQQQPDDLILRGSLLWSIIYSVVQSYRQRGAPYQIVRHMDLSLSPATEFQKLYANLGLDYTAQTEQRIARATSANNPTEVSTDKRHAVNLDSRANLKNWHKRLTPDEIARIRDLTGAVAQHFYQDQDWQL